ncbi:hypothetical protein [Shewanella aestuarii]|uniref:Uncharacterized protein n=1 Tax=Shewanella aestuarii TaxID=1028752 RepID=A0A6G9QRV7_9GAMM|nr:hypothetical protein [Shewanella aestuarii]QIR16529.1 hypothetical protein HBH39_18810 [Shewanella aestuarii]
MKHIKSTTLAILISMLVCGCASTKKEETAYNVVDMTDIDMALMQSAKAIQSSIKIMEENKNFIASRSKSNEETDKYAEQMTYIPNGLDVPITLNDRLPLQKTLKIIGYLTGYQVLTVNPPQNDISKSVRVYARPAIYVLRDLGVELGEEAHIAVMPFKEPKPDGMLGIITVTYAETLGAGR